MVDGASTDNTEDVMRRYVNVDPRIRYVRLPARGVDQDYDKSVELAHGEFCWFFTDDNLLRPGAVAGDLCRSSITGCDGVAIEAYGGSV